MVRLDYTHERQLMLEGIESWKEGFKEGFMESFEKSFKEGWQKEWEKRRAETVWRMFQTGKLTVKEIAECSGLSTEEVEHLVKSSEL